jgi:hypothetical protein
MIRKILPALLISSAASLAMQAQDVQWASKVVNFSTEFVDASLPKQFNAIQALGKPSVTSDFGSSQAAWSPSTRGV